MNDFYKAGYACGVGSLVFLGVNYFFRQQLNAAQLTPSINKLEELIGSTYKAILSCLGIAFICAILGTLD